MALGGVFHFDITEAVLLQGLDKLLDWDGAAQQRLQNLAVWDVITCPLSLLTTCGLGGPGRGLKNMLVVFSVQHG